MAGTRSGVNGCIVKADGPGSRRCNGRLCSL
jgi:hypothetical protein